MLSPRERVLCALEHEEPDRVPIFFGTSGVTTMLAPAYERFRTHLGLPPGPGRLISRAFQYARLDEDVLERCPSDGRPLLARAPASTLARELSAGSYIDEWGVTWQRAPGTPYFDVSRAPLRGATINDLERYPWPALGDRARFAGLRAEAQAIQSAGYAVVALTGASLFEQIALLRGLDAWLLDLAADPEFAQALLRKVTDLMLASIEGLLAEAGPFIDVVVTADDLGTQSAPIISPRMYRRLIKPCHLELMAAIKRGTRARILYHCDGAIYPLIEDLIDIGIDILNPVQVSARDMGDTARLKREFGSRLSFCGGIDTGRVLPEGSPDEVRAEVRRRIGDLAPGGGYILSAVHCIQPDVPPANVCAMFDEALAAGRYPLAHQLEDHL